MPIYEVLLTCTEPDGTMMFSRMVEADDPDTALGSVINGLSRITGKDVVELLDGAHTNIRRMPDSYAALVRLDPDRGSANEPASGGTQ